MISNKILLIFFSFFIINSNSINSKQQLVKNVQEFNEAVKNATPGDEIILANGIWKDAELVFRQKGTKEQPITLRAEENGKVLLSGLSNLSVSGELDMQIKNGV